jgi:hypothetical protein
MGDKGSSKEYRKNWVRLIQQIYEVDPLICSKLVLSLAKECQRQMKIIAFIEDEKVIKKILKHLGLWEVKKRPPPKLKSPPSIVDIDHPSSVAGHSLFCPDPNYPVERYITQ